MNLLLPGMIIPGLFSHVDPRILCSLAAVLCSLSYVASSLTTSFSQLVATYALIGAVNHRFTVKIFLTQATTSDRASVT